ncbi:hypothetical protein B0J12DRAFT_707817 [Macrophomina phaseolina]|uniref:Intradiol ring-cleavage dioxygenase core n=1 Tax=Macrophomina phaseolina TaxID=35725 RepID=A0ABQ8GQV1_9PEZI|nr:hypothetical protein B0J12DRAFT_707817 [Macrophomina phaseolina]
MDMATCEPQPNALISLFHCNATRSCSSFTGFGPTIPFERLLDSLNLTMSNRVTILNETIGGDPNGNYTMGVTDIHSDDETWLRGTIFPGYYAERTIHLHIQVYKDWVIGANGTVVSGEGVSKRVVSDWPYSLREGQLVRTTNDVDMTAIRWSSVVPVDGKDVQGGVIGYIILGVDTAQFK